MEFLNTAIGVITLIGIGVGMGLLRSNYVTKAEFKEHQEKCECAMEKKFDEVNQARKDVWNKIDQIHGWMWDLKSDKG